MRQKIQALLAHLNHGLVDREPALKATLLSVLAGENIVLVGPPGTGKSLLARRIAQGLGGGEGGLSYFEYLLTKFSTPEELFGPLSITALKNDRFHRNTDGYLPSVELAFLDEVFKASSSILNALLTLMNERIFHNGADREDAPLRALIAASNELLTGQDELAALYDRFLVRSFVDYVREDSLPKLLEAPPVDSAQPLAEYITLQDMVRLKEAAQAVTLPPVVAQALQQIWQAHREAFKEDRRESLSDRRLMKCLNLLRVSAATNGRAEVDLSDVLLLKDCLWNHPDNANKVMELMLDVLRRHSYPVPVGQPLLLVDGSPAPNQRLTYEVGSDGSTLVPVSALAGRTVVPAIQSAKPIGQMNAVVKGFCGSGTEQDPLLVQSVHDLMDLARPEVGRQGYHFRQTADIDCSNLNSWMEVEFQGFFNGDRKNILFNYYENTPRYLFSVVHEKSMIENVIIHGWGVARNIEKSEINYCKLILESKENNRSLWGKSLGLTGRLNECRMSFCSSDCILVNDEALKSKIEFCASDSYTIGKADDCQIISCSSEYAFFRDGAKSCKIFDCCACYSQEAGGLYKYMIEQCCVERFFISSGDNGYLPGSNYSCGMVGSIQGGYLKNCAIGEIAGESLKNRICGNFQGAAQLINNYSVDTNEILSGGNDKNGENGQSVSKELTIQRFFENTLGWDFDDVWYWDDVTNQPVLRYAGVDAHPPALNVHHAAASVAQDADMEDLLTRQVQANIWL